MDKTNIFNLIDKLKEQKILSNEEFLQILNESNNESVLDYLSAKAREVSKKTFSNLVYTRGLIEISNYCKNDCYYCGIRRGNKNIERYRLSKEDILGCCEIGYHLGFRTFVMQGGEDPFFTDERLCDIVKEIKAKYPDCAITLSLGERSYDSYKDLKEAGADRYLLRHESANECHYKKIHPSEMSLKNRKECLYNLKKLGYQVGTGIMVGSPYQTLENVVEDLNFINELKPEMVGIGPFLPHKETPFKDEQMGSYNLTLMLVGLVRLMLPNALLPSTTALGTIKQGGREQGILFGANVVMPNLSPLQVRKKYMLYDNKISTNEEAAEGREKLIERMKSIGYELSMSRGDYNSNVD